MSAQEQGGRAVAEAQILIVEDEVIVAHNLADRLKRLGYGVSGVVSFGEEAVEQAAEKKPDLVLMDIKLQGEMDGVTAAREIRACFDIPVVYLTGYADSPTLERAKVTEPFGYILKPFQARELQTSIEMALYKHQMEKRLRKSEERYRAVSELATDYVYVADVEADGRIALQWITSAFTRITGFTLDELETSGGLESLVYPGDVPVFVQRTQNLLSGHPDVSEFRIVTGSGDIRWVCSYARPVWDESQSRVVRIYGAAQDITERKRAEERLQEYSEQLEVMVDERTAEVQAQYARLDAILSSVSDGIIVTDGQGEILQANPVAQTWLTQTLSPEEVDQLREMVRNVATRTEGQPVELLELTGLDLELSGAPISEPLEENVIQSPNGKPAAVVAIHDVSELKALDRMKTRFVSNISHELRTPISTIKLYAHLMQKQPEKWETYADALRQEADHQARLVEDVLQISRIDAGRLEISPCLVPLNDLTEFTVARFQVLAQEQGLALEHRPAHPEPVVLVDPTRMTQVLDNLVGNALRYTFDGGAVTVSTGQQRAMGQAWATVTVADTGMGIPEDDLPYIFDRFFRGEEPRAMQLTGTGLGLSIAKEIVELHGGQVTVESKEGVGSAFTIWLPPAEKQMQRDTTTEEGA